MVLNERKRLFASTVLARSALIQCDTKSAGITHEIASAPCDSSRIHVRGLRLAREEHIAERSASSRSRTRCDCRWRTSTDRMRTGFCVPCMDSVFQIPISLSLSMRVKVTVVVTSRLRSLTPVGDYRALAPIASPRNMRSKPPRTSCAVPTNVAMSSPLR
jgi:hypothetical protein